MGAKKAKPKKAKSSSSIGSKLASAGKAIMGKSSSASGGKRRGRHGVTWWANRVLVEKLKKKYHRLKYGSVR